MYVRPDGRQLTELAALLAAGDLAVPIAAAYPIEEAAVALAAAGGTGHADGANVLTAG